MLLVPLRAEKPSWAFGGVVGDGEGLDPEKAGQAFDVALLFSSLLW